MDTLNQVLATMVTWFGGLSSAAQNLILVDAQKTIADGAGSAEEYAKYLAEFPTVGAFAEKEADGLAELLAKEGEEKEAKEALPDKRAIAKATTILDRAEKTFVKALRGWRDGLILTGKLCHEYVLARLAIPRTKRSAAIEAIEGRLSEYDTNRVDANRLIECYHVHRLLCEVPGIDSSRIPYNVLRECTKFVERLSIPSKNTEEWRLYPPTESAALALFADMAELEHSPKLSTVRADVLRIIAEAMAMVADEAAKKAANPGAADESALKEAAKEAQEAAKKAQEKADKAREQEEEQERLAALTPEERKEERKAAKAAKQAQTEAAPTTGNPVERVKEALAKGTGKDAGNMLATFFADIPQEQVRDAIGAFVEAIYSAENGYANVKALATECRAWIGDDEKPQPKNGNGKPRGKGKKQLLDVVIPGAK